MRKLLHPDDFRGKKNRNHSESDKNLNLPVRKASIARLCSSFEHDPNRFFVKNLISFICSTL